MVLVASVVDGEGGKATNELFRLVGGYGSRRRRWKMGKGHQRVVWTRWWCWWLALSVEEDRQGYKSLGLIRGAGGWRRRWNMRKGHE